MGILMGTPDEQQFDPWSFLTPLTNELWLLIIVTSFVVGTVITILDKLSPYGYHGESNYKLSTMVMMVSQTVG